MRRFLVLEHVLSIESDTLSSMEEPVQDFETEEEAIAWINHQSAPDSFFIEDQLEDFNDHLDAEDDGFYPVEQNYRNYADLEDDETLLYDSDQGEY